ncbi:MAG: VCBS repeat-containing protein [Theionarchaea archaeon]|nr:VCBS repeat-containing protein [Theionarchaea archaeon]
MKKYGLLLIFLFLGVLPSATSWYGPSLTYGTGSDSTRSVATGDLDKDGNIDLVVGNYGEQNLIYFGDGDGTFDTRSATVGSVTSLTREIILGDVNNDTWLDIIVGNHQQQDVIHLNDGDGTFDTIQYIMPSVGSNYTFALALGDVNGDSLPDLVVGNLEEENLVYLNDGDGHPYDSIPLIVFGIAGPDYGNTWDVALAYMNGDANLDIIVANHQQYNYVYLGDGDGTFDTTSFQFGVQTEFTHSIAVGYFNGDAFLDVVEGNYSAQNKVYVGDGTGNLTLSYTFDTLFSKTQIVVAADVNNDTFLDVVVGNGGDEPQYNRVFHGMGDGTLDGGYSLTANQDITWGLALDFFNGDGMIDAAIANVGQNYIYLNLDIGIDTIASLFDSNTFFVAGDTAYCTDVLGSAKIAFALGEAGTLENPEGRTDVILTTSEHNTGNLIPVGGPAINPIADEFNGYFGISYAYVEGVSFTILAGGESIFLDITQYPHEDICIVYISEHNNRNVMLVWGYGWQGTYAGSVYIGNTANWPTHADDHMLMIRWIDTNADGLVQSDEITVEETL